MKAEEARKLAIKINIDSTDSQYNAILSSIKIAANRGEYEMSYSGLIKADVKAILEKDGYTLKEAQERYNNWSTTISWQ